MGLFFGVWSAASLLLQPKLKTAFALILSAVAPLLLIASNSISDRKAIHFVQEEDAPISTPESNNRTPGEHQTEDMDLAGDIAVVTMVEDANRPRLLTADGVDAIATETTTILEYGGVNSDSHTVRPRCFTADAVVDSSFPGDAFSTVGQCRARLLSSDLDNSSATMSDGETEVRSRLLSVEEVDSAISNENEVVKTSEASVLHVLDTPGPCETHAGDPQCPYEEKDMDQEVTEDRTTPTNMTIRNNNKHLSTDERSFVQDREETGGSVKNLRLCDDVTPDPEDTVKVQLVPANSLFRSSPYEDAEHSETESEAYGNSTFDVQEDQDQAESFVAREEYDTEGDAEIVEDHPCISHAIDSCSNTIPNSMAWRDSVATEIEGTVVVNDSVKVVVLGRCSDLRTEVGRCIEKFSNASSICTARSYKNDPGSLFYNVWVLPEPTGVEGRRLLHATRDWICSQGAVYVVVVDPESSVDWLDETVNDFVPEYSSVLPVLVHESSEAFYVVESERTIGSKNPLGGKVRWFPPIRLDHRENFQRSLLEAGRECNVANRFADPSCLPICRLVEQWRGEFKLLNSFIRQTSPMVDQATAEKSMRYLNESGRILYFSAPQVVLRSQISLEFLVRWIEKSMARIRTRNEAKSTSEQLHAAIGCLDGVSCHLKSPIVEECDAREILLQELQSMSPDMHKHGNELASGALQMLHRCGLLIAIPFLADRCYLVSQNTLAPPNLGRWAHATAEAWNTTLCFSWQLDNVKHFFFNRIVSQFFCALVKNHCSVVQAAEYYQDLIKCIVLVEDPYRENTYREGVRICLSVRDLKDPPKKLVTLSGKGSSAEFGRSWKQFFSGVLEFIRLELSQHSGPEPEELLHCYKCLEQKPADSTNVYTPRQVRRLQMCEEYEGSLQCKDICCSGPHGRHAIEIDHLSCHPVPPSTEKHPEPSRRCCEPPSACAVLICAMSEDGEIQEVGSGLLYDTTRVLIVTAAHIFFRLDPGEQFGQQKFKKALVGLTSRGTGTKAKLRYIATLVSDESSRAVRQVDACLLQISGEFVPSANQHRSVSKKKVASELFHMRAEHPSIARAVPESGSTIRLHGFAQPETTCINFGLGVYDGTVASHFKPNLKLVRAQRRETCGYLANEMLVVYGKTERGMSGCPAVNEEGEVVGILSSTDRIDERKSYVVPMSEIQPLIDQIPPDNGSRDSRGLLSEVLSMIVN